eukprot:TRINITY_DN22974_c0_g2_i2.p1 TRINITY_DN22974_c0_g2~~TRINITY_DN22974_c0_g2_i2.p1  ORF type:complete len:557 (+),score=59.94 TRINITY_DN22974_c0_g2_i2:190-1671(+)
MSDEAASESDLGSGHGTPRPCEPPLWPAERRLLEQAFESGALGVPGSTKRKWRAPRRKPEPPKEAWRDLFELPSSSSTAGPGGGHADTEAGAEMAVARPAAAWELVVRPLPGAERSSAPSAACAGASTGAGAGAHGGGLRRRDEAPEMAEWLITDLEWDGYTGRLLYRDIDLPHARYVESPRFMLCGEEVYLRFWPNGYFSKTQRKGIRAYDPTCAFVRSWCAVALFAPAGTRWHLRFFVGDDFSDVRECYWCNAVTQYQYWMPRATEPSISLDEGLRVGVEILRIGGVGARAPTPRSSLTTRRASQLATTSTSTSPTSGASPNSRAFSVHTPRAGTATSRPGTTTPRSAAATTTPSSRARSTPSEAGAAGATPGTSARAVGRPTGGWRGLRSPSPASLTQPWALSCGTLLREDGSRCSTPLAFTGASTGFGLEDTYAALLRPASAPIPSVPTRTDAPSRSNSGSSPASAAVAAGMALSSSRPRSAASTCSTR